MAEADIEAVKGLLARMAVKWPDMNGAAARKIDALLHQRREAVDAIMALLSDHAKQAETSGSLENELRETGGFLDEMRRQLTIAQGERDGVSAGEAVVHSSDLRRTELQAQVYREMHEQAVAMGYECILTALEDLDRLKGSASPTPPVSPEVERSPWKPDREAVAREYDSGAFAEPSSSNLLARELGGIAKRREAALRFADRILSLPHNGAAQ